MNIWISIVLITVCAVAWNAGVVFQKQAADRLPAIVLGRALPRTLFAFLSSGRWMFGLALSAGGWGLWAYALDFTPISLARAIQGSGFVALAVFSVLFLDHRLRPREWAAVAVVTAGIVALGFSEPPGQPTPTVIAPLPLALAVGITLALCLLAFIAGKIAGRHWVVVFGTVSGTLAGLGDVFTKTLVVELDAHKYLAAFAVMLPALSVFYISQIFILTKAYQHGRAIVAVGVNDFLARLVAIFVGVFALGEAMPEDPALRLYRLGGFAVVLAGTVLLARFSGEQLLEDAEAPSSLS